MHLRQASDVTPIQSAHGEQVQELIGQAAGGSAAYSLATITLLPGKASLVHYHPVVEECYYVLSGEGTLRIDDQTLTLKPGQTVAILPPAVHQIRNDRATNLVFLAVCVPPWTPDCSIFLDSSQTSQR